jgi:hypothetical protein
VEVIVAFKLLGGGRLKVCGARRAFAAARFNGEERHLRRLAKVLDIERRETDGR